VLLLKRKVEKKTLRATWAMKVEDTFSQGGPERIEFHKFIIQVLETIKALTPGGGSRMFEESGVAEFERRLVDALSLNENQEIRELAKQELISYSDEFKSLLAQSFVDYLSLKILLNRDPNAQENLKGLL
jgi:hypothetical protein